MSSMPADAPRRPRLLAQNRKLRHLRGISLRNLTFAPPLPPPPPQMRNLRSADDNDAHARSKAKMKKLPILQEPIGVDGAGASGPAPSLRLSRSLEELSVSSSSSSPSSPSCPSSSEPAAKMRRRRSSREKEEPPPTALLRHASLSLAHANPASRRRKLRNLADAAVGDVFFSLHDPAKLDEPVYISEMVERSANFDFRFFNLSPCGPSIARSCRVLVRIWTRRPKHESWIFLLEELVDLRSLRFISTTLNRKFRPNALIFHLEDGVYSLDFPDRIAEPRQAPPLVTSSYNALMKLANLEGSLGDAQDTQRDIMLQMNDLVEAEPVDGADMAEENVAFAKKCLTVQRRLNRQTERRRDELRESLRARREAIVAGRALQRQREEDMAGSREELCASRRVPDDTARQIRGQRRRICTDLARIFPITPSPCGTSLSFQICGITLPNSVYDAAVSRSIGEDALSAALGLVALLTRHLQFYLGRPLPYEIVHQGSRSYVRDDISYLDDNDDDKDNHRSKTVGSREFPLFLPRGGSTASQWRFEYAWFLLNKDIEALCASQGLRVVDIRHSLPNLKYLLYVGSAGSGGGGGGGGGGEEEMLPERKKGGVRGLFWAARRTGQTGDGNDDANGSTVTSMTGSRPGSADSEAQRQRKGDLLRCAAVESEEGGEIRRQQKQQRQPSERENKTQEQREARGAEDWGDGPPSSGLSLRLPFGGAETKFTLRTKGLRENVAG